MHWQVAFVRISPICERRKASEDEGGKGAGGKHHGGEEDGAVESESCHFMIEVVWKYMYSLEWISIVIGWGVSQ